MNDADILARLQGLSGAHEDFVWTEAKSQFDAAKGSGSPASVGDCFENALDLWDEYEARRTCLLACCDLIASHGRVSWGDPELHTILTMPKGESC